MHKRILIIPDAPNWALDKNANDLIKYNKSNLELKSVYFEDFIQDWKRYYDEYDLLFPMYKGLFFQMLEAKIPTDKVITGIRSYHYWDKKKATPPGYNVKPPHKVIRKLKKAVLVNTNCKKIWYLFSEYMRVIHTKYTCDINMFFPEEKKIKNEKLVIGWAGSLTNHPGKRGFHEFIKPITDEFPEVELKVQESGKKLITDDNEMRDFYNSLDLYFAASRTETGPRTVLESAACGVPAISTDIGLVPELLDNNIDGFIVDRNYEAMRNKIKWIIGNREVLPDMGKLIRLKMETEFNWENIIFQWTDFFKYAIELTRLKKEGYIS